MNAHMKRAIGALILLVSAATGGYQVGTNANHTPDIPTTTVTAPPPGSTRVIYSLTDKRNDQEVIALINGAKTKIYFAIYEFTLKDVADALVAAKQRGVEVRGVVDSGEAAKSYDQAVIRELTDAGIPVETEKHPTGNGIMHIKAIVTDSAYALGSYNWTASATTANDEILEIGTDPTLRQTYENLLKQLLDAYAGTNAAALAAATVSAGTIDYTDAPQHIGETASVHATLVKAYTAKSGVTFLDFCKDYKNCPFSAVIFTDDIKKFPSLDSFVGQQVIITGKLTSYQGTAEIVVKDPFQLSK